MGQQASTGRQGSTHSVRYLDEDNVQPGQLKRAKWASLCFGASRGKVVGFFGVDGVRAFDAMLADGSLGRQGSLPPGYVKLMGPILPTLDYPSYSRVHKALRPALSGPAHLQMFRSVIREVLHHEHHRWVGRGGVQSLATMSADLVFRILLAIYFDERNDDQVKALRPLVNDFIQGMDKSVQFANHKAVTIREKLMKDLVVPALLRSRERVARGEVTGTCVLDTLVADKQLNDHEIQTHVFHLFVAGLGAVEPCAVNSITAFCVHEDEHAKLVQARTELGAKYPSVDERWQHVDEMGYISRFLHEVARYYAVHPAKLVGRATRTVKVSSVTSNGKDKRVVKVRRGTLCTAVLDSATWTHADTFLPNRFLYHKHNEMFPRAVDNELRTLVVQCMFASLLDHEWKMLPFQDYSLANANGMPKSGLMAANFTRRTDEVTPGNLFQVVGCHDDWKFLLLPEAKRYQDDFESVYEMLTDSRLDTWTHLMMKLLAHKQAKWVVPNAATALKLPKYQRELPKIQLKNTNIMVPTVDEDSPLDPWYEKAAMVFLRDTLPIHDNFTDDWVPGEDKEAYVLGKVGKMWPRVNVHWHDRYSDRALELLVFNGLAQHMVEKLPVPQADGSYYGVLLDFMQALDVRPGFAKYGADVFFTKDGKVVKIVRHGRTYVPGDDQWEYVKFCFRSSLNTKVTAVDHLFGMHCTVANDLTIASRELLPVDHPLRRLVKPFTFRSVVINYAAAWAMFWPKGMLHRGFAFTEAGMKQTWDYGLGKFDVTTFPEQVAKQEVDTLKMPYHEDGLDYWHVVRTFVSDYVDLYFADDRAVLLDMPTVTFWHYMAKQPGDTRPLTLSNLKDMLAQLIFWVSGMHNHMGTVAEYVSDPAFCGSAWVEGEASNRPGSAVRIALIMSATGFPQPSVLEDFTHVMLDDKAKRVCREFTAALVKLGEKVDARNTTRVQPYQSFNPNTIELAVSI